jgi:large subunit ribosomal protein L6
MTDRDASKKGIGEVVASCEERWSRIGRQPIEIPSGVDVTVGDDAVVVVKGPRGELTQRVHPEMRIVRDEDVLRVERPSDEGLHRSLHGLTRSLIANMVEGVTKGYEKRLAIVGVGYRRRSGKASRSRWASRTPSGPRRRDRVRDPTPLDRGAGNDKQLVGEVAANIRKIRKPEPYKGKGIRYENEYVRKKAGKAAKGATA